MSECSWVLSQIRSMGDGVFNYRGGVDRAAGEYTICEEGSVSGYLRSLRGRHEIVAEEIVPRMCKAVESIGTDMQWLSWVEDRIRPMGAWEIHLLQESLIVCTVM